MDQTTLPDLDAFREMLTAKGFLGPLMPVENEANGTVVSIEARGPTDDEAIAELPVLGDDELRLGASIGAGGMGIIVGAEQASLVRDVAVKCARGSDGNRHEASGALLREGRVTGALQHPNIVPVHALGRNERGEVLLVMKRIAGTLWADELQARGSVGEDLRRHIEILMEVCRAAHFAHTHGFLHRDLKPENVMLGPLGEVYVLDWGLAAGIDGHTIPGLAGSHAGVRFAGTPAYMAPEMATVDGHLDARSDVYCLGAVLYKVITGAPPHRGADMAEKLYNAFMSAPKTVVGDVPAELARICTQAMEREPKKRFASADEMRRALGDFLQHATARAVCADARPHLAELQRLVEARSDDDLAAHRAFSACRFGFEAALRTWPDSDEATRGRAAALAAMVTFEVHRQHADAARVLLRDLASPPPVLAALVDKLEAERAQDAMQATKARALARDLDVAPGARRRAGILLVCALAWLVFTVGAGMLDRAGVHRLNGGEFFAAHVVVTGLLALLRTFAAGGEQSRVGRHILDIAVVALVGMSVAWLVLWRGEVPIPTGIAVAQLFVVVAVWTSGAFFDRRVLPATALVLAGIPCAVLFPRYALDCGGLTVACGMAWYAWVWRRGT